MQTKYMLHRVLLRQVVTAYIMYGHDDHVLKKFSNEFQPASMRPTFCRQMNAPRSTKKRRCRGVLTTSKNVTNPRSTRWPGRKLRI